MDEGRRRRDEGQERVDSHTDEAWKDAADAAIARLARTGRPFTAEDLTDLVGMPPRHNAIGSRFTTAARAGLIEEIGYKQSTRAARHASRMLVWRGTNPRPTLW